VTEPRLTCYRGGGGGGEKKKTYISGTQIKSLAKNFPVTADLYESCY